MTRLVPLLLVLLVVGCAPKSVAVYTSAIPDTTPPVLTLLEVAEGDCPAESALVPGSPAPYVDAVGVAECGAVVLPVARASELYRDARVLLPYWREMTAAQVEGRQADRDHCQRTVDLLAEDRNGYRRDALVLRVVLPVAVTVAAVAAAGVGFGVGAAAAGGL